MIVKKLSLAGFRNIKNASLGFSGGINILYGKNAQGKTNILESIYICATGRSHRTRFDSRLIDFNGHEAHIKVEIENMGRQNRIDVHLKKDEKNGVKGIAVNGIPIKKSGDLFGTLYCVIFSPEDLQLIKNSPGERRRFIDMELCQLKNVYYYDLGQYYKVLKQRNSLLKKIQKNYSFRDTVSVWDEQLAAYGMRVIENREKFIKKISRIAGEKHSKITGGAEKLEICYRPNCHAEELLTKTAQNLERDIIFGSTSAGPHKDDIIFTVNGSDVKVYGSQGQQRTAALSAKLAERDIIKEETGTSPVLLLDDVLSELDSARQRFLFESINGVQSVVTCTGIEDIAKNYSGKGGVFFVENGNVTPAIKNKA